MSKRRLIPKLQLKTSSYNSNKLVLVNTKQFNEVIEIGDPVSQAKIFQDQAADELIFIDLDQTLHHSDGLLKVIRSVSEEIFMPMTVGGGVTSLDDFKMLLANGADKISINSQAVKNKTLITEASLIFGAQCVVVSIDIKKNNNGKYTVFIDKGKTDTGLDPVDWAVECEKLGAGEILLTSIDADGMREGMETTICKQVSDNVNIPVVLSGGCGRTHHFIDAFKEGHADAVAAGTFFSMKDENFMQTRAQIKNSGVNIRVHT